MIHLTVEVTNPAELLDPEAYDAGALLRWEWSATIDGSYVEGGTEALVADQFLHDIWDDAGTDATWYRTRVSDTGGTSFSEYTAPFQPATAQLYLSLAQLKALAPSTLNDESLLILLSSAATEIVRYAGASGEVSEVVHARGPLLMLSHAAGGVTTVVEDAYGSAVTLDATDYELSRTGQVLRRLQSGTNPGYYWRGHVRVTYAQPDDLAIRQRVQLELVRLTMTFSPGLASQTIGTWTETYQTAASGKTYEEQRTEILATLTDPVFVL
jgi:hypothetical protein